MTKGSVVVCRKSKQCQGDRVDFSRTDRYENGLGQGLGLICMRSRLYCKIGQRNYQRFQCKFLIGLMENFKSGKSRSDSNGYTSRKLSMNGHLSIGQFSSLDQ